MLQSNWMLESIKLGGSRDETGRWVHGSSLYYFLHFCTFEIHRILKIIKKEIEITQCKECQNLWLGKPKCRRWNPEG